MTVLMLKKVKVNCLSERMTHCTMVSLKTVRAHIICIPLFISGAVKRTWSPDWLEVSNEAGKTGLVPRDYVVILQ